MNYEEMSDFEVSKRVAEIVYGAVEVMELVYARNKSSAVWTCPIDGLKSFDINNPSDAWPIIVENEITICPDVYIGGWYGQKDIDSGMDGDSIHITKDKNPLRAAMICFLKMKEGE